MATIVSFNCNRAQDLNGFASPGALARFYKSGTNTAKVVYADAACSIPHPSPLVADGAGVFPPVYDTGDGDVKVSVTDARGAMLAGYPMDPVQIISTDTTGASGIAFSPTESIPETNVQDAIERVQVNILAPLADYGLGVTGNATLLSDMDNTTIAAGVYRFAASTNGTFPAGVTPPTGGVVRIWRATANSAIMILSPSGARRQHTRVLADGGWQPWSYLIQSTDTATDVAWAAGTSTAPAIPSPAAIKAAASADPRAWQVVTANRSAGTTYQNTTGRTIQVMLSVGVNASGSVLCGATAGGMVMLYTVSDWDSWPITFDVPPGFYYRLNSPDPLNRWVELR